MTLLSYEHVKSSGVLFSSRNILRPNLALLEPNISPMPSNTSVFGHDASLNGKVFYMEEAKTKII